MQFHFKRKTLSSSDLKNATRSFERLSITSLQIDEKFSTKLKRRRSVPLLSNLKRYEPNFPSISKVSQRSTRESNRRNTGSFSLTGSSLGLKERKVENILKKTELEK